MLLLAGSAGLGRHADFAAPLLPQEPRSLAIAPATAATSTYLTRPAPQVGERRGFEVRKGLLAYGVGLPWWRSLTEPQNQHPLRTCLSPSLALSCVSNE